MANYKQSYETLAQKMCETFAKHSLEAFDIYLHKNTKTLLSEKIFKVMYIVPDSGVLAYEMQKGASKYVKDIYELLYNEDLEGNELAIHEGIDFCNICLLRFPEVRCTMRSTDFFEKYPQAYKVALAQN